jgi:hypothetical protein
MSRGRLGARARGKARERDGGLAGLGAGPLPLNETTTRDAPAAKETLRPCEMDLTQASVVRPLVEVAMIMPM